MAWLADAAIKLSLESVIGVTSGTLVAHWDQIIADANQQAQADISSIFLARGYTQAQIDAWASAAASLDRGKVYHRRQSLFWCGIWGKHHLTEAEVPLLEKMDCRAELAGLLLTEDGVVIQPDPDTLGTGAGSGLLTVREEFDATVAAGRDATDTTYIW